VRRRFSEVVEVQFGVRTDQPAIGFPPDVELGELSITACFELAKQLRQAPRRIADTLAAHILPIEGVERVSVAAPGYLNFHLDRARLAAAVFEARSSEPPPTPATPGIAAEGKVLVEHTSINPNKAAHVGHLRNSILGDTFARLLRFTGRQVEVQNYIDNTGVQVADVVVGFVDLEKKGMAEVEALIADPAVRFDYYCWNLYARVTQAYEQNPALTARRAETLKAIEDGHGETARIAELISTVIVRAHLETTRRLGVRYDLLVQESEILSLNFWKYAFELLRERGALRFEDSGKNKGCWVMSLAAGEEGKSAEGVDAAGEAVEEETKIIVRSNGTVTYVGKDIAYHLWKFGLLGRDFGYEPFYRYPDGGLLWRTTARGQGSGVWDQGSETSGQGTEPSMIPDPRPLSPVPCFGRASAAYAVIDSRQSYLQQVVAAAFRELGYQDEAAHLHHFAYEVVNLSLAAAESLGIEPTAEDRERGYVEVSGRRGLGVKADDLIDIVIEKALAEVRERRMTSDPDEQAGYARMIGVAALRYFLLKFTRRSAIAFDFKDALAFEGETGPYLQYSVVRAQNILRRVRDQESGVGGQGREQVKDDIGVPDREPPSMKDEPDSKIDHRPSTIVNRQISWPPAPDSRSLAWLQGADGRDFWELVLLSAQLEMTVRQAVSSEEPAVLAKYAFRLAQAFNNFYHRHRVLSESDPERRSFLLFLVLLSSQTLALALDLLGIEVPERM
jgi:arginyl-tRNA synthetase